MPMIAAINGYCLGGGLELAMACDFRIASTKAIFGQPEIKLGLIPGAGGTQRLPRLIGKTIAKEMILLGESINAEKALSIGLVNAIVEPEKLDATAMEYAQKLAKGPKFAIAQAKEAINRGTEMAWFDAIQMESNLFTLCYTHEDFQEGVSAFLEKRKANFK
jgi:enoyl-CoA hydratase